MSRAKSLRVYEVDSGRLLESAENPDLAEAEADSLDLSPDGSLLVAATRDLILRFDANTLRRRGPALRGPASGSLVGFSHDGRFLLSTSDDHSAIVWDAATGALLHRLAATNGDLSAAGWSPDEHTVYTTSGVDVAENDLLMSWGLDPDSGLLTLGEATPAIARNG